MSVFHYRASLQQSSTTKAVYLYQPDYISSEKVCGKFELDIKNWRAEITLKTSLGKNESVSTDERCVSALTYKIKKHFEETGQFPEEIYFIA